MNKLENLPTPDRPPPSAIVGNRLLGALPPDEYTRIAATLDIIPLTLRDFFHKPGDPIKYVYFPGGGFFSMVTVLADGRMVEIATVGREGMVGVSAMWGDAPTTSATMVQGETDTCYRMAADAFRREIQRRGRFAELITRFSQALFGFVAQSTACNAVHSVEQRLARWLLMASDRMESDEFPLTQEFVAMMLGATRPTVTVVAGALQTAGLIRYHRGRMTILDREQLKRTSCECYSAVTASLLAVTALPRRPDASARRRIVTTAGVAQMTSRSRT
jgi:CRP-like cAMP-binding protein